MLKRLARKPSTASETPAITKIANAISIWLDTMAQTITGTRMMRPRVMMFGMLNLNRFPARSLILLDIRLFCAAALCYLHSIAAAAPRAIARGRNSS
ncbi:hypothetical protein ABIF03_000569 [Bradyrhizobium elkanii]